MVRFYGVTKFELFSILDEKWLCPKETKVEFYYDTTRKINHARLQRILERDIKKANKFYMAVEDNKIIIHIHFSKEIGLLDYDLCKN